MAALMIAAVTLDEARARIAKAYRYDVTFFGFDDVWLFFAVMDDRVCPECEAYDGRTFRGSTLRGFFPYLDVVSIDKIMAEGPGGTGLVHPNCRCYLMRQPKPETGRRIRVKDLGPIVDDRKQELDEQHEHE